MDEAAAHGKAPLNQASPLQSAWIPSPEFIATTNIAWLMREVGVDTYEALHEWSVQNREQFWMLAIGRLDICFRRPFDSIVDLSQGVEQPCWLPGAQFNIVESCFAAPPESPAVLSAAEGKPFTTTTVSELEALTNRVAFSLAQAGFKAGDAIAVVMPMTVECVAIYLGVIKAGCMVVGIADSFQPREIGARLRLASASAVFTQDVILRGGKSFPLYSNIIEANAPPAIVLLAADRSTLPLRQGDWEWATFLRVEDCFEALPCEPSDTINVLFSSGTTGEPKVIPWTQTTPLKCATDAHFHQNIQPGDVLVWPTNIGWMMGPWLIFASLLNGATMGLYNGSPTGRDFGCFVQETHATMLGVTPSLVRTWRTTDCLEGLDWSALELFSSTGESSSPDDMAWLMAFAGGRPVIEYCGGTEIGGGYISGTVTRPCVPGLFNTPALGLDIVVLDENGMPDTTGEAFIVPPSIGLSTTLLKGSHHEVYFEGAPAGPGGTILRRHGDQIKRLPDGYWVAQGRVDDTMNLSGIKVSSAEIEQVFESIAQVKETAAIAVSPDSGPSLLVIYAVSSTTSAPCVEDLKATMQTAIKRNLNPLFKIHDVILIPTLPRNASNKVMRRALRLEYLSRL